jgi:hypothetical protein
MQRPVHQRDKASGLLHCCLSSHGPHCTLIPNEQTLFGSLLDSRPQEPSLVVTGVTAPQSLDLILSGWPINCVANALGPFVEQTHAHPTPIESIAPLFQARL